MPKYAIGDKKPELAQDAWVALSADLIGQVQMASQSSVWFGAVIRADNSAISIGARSNVQECSVVHSDVDAPCIVGEDCTVGHHAMLHGCVLGNRVLVGMRAMILDRTIIGDDCLVAAGAVVTRGKKFQAGRLIMGAPAVDVRPLTSEELALLRASAAHYVERAALFADGLQEIP